MKFLKKTFVFAFRRSLPIMIGFFPLGAAYGIVMQSAGYNLWWTLLTSTAVFAGSLQFLMVSFFGGGFSIITVALLSLLLNSRHIFYGLSFIERFRKYKTPSRLYLIFALPDETYSLHCSYKPQQGVSEEGAFVLTALLVHLYWVVFSVLGNIVGSLIKFNTKGIDFALTALFVVILLDRMKDSKSKLPAIIAVCSSVLCILIFAKDSFILPSLTASVAVLIILRKKLEPTLSLDKEIEK